MRTVAVTRRVVASVAEAERCWYDTAGWASWIDGLDQVLEVRGDWPEAGATVTWESGPAGRGRVTERVIAHEPGRGQTVEVQDPSIRGRQTVTFVAGDGDVEVSLALEYGLVRRSLVSPFVDALFIRRAMTTSLGLTLAHFAGRLATADSRRRGHPEVPPED